MRYEIGSHVADPKSWASNIMVYALYFVQSLTHPTLKELGTVFIEVYEGQKIIRDNHFFGLSQFLIKNLLITVN